MRSSTPAFSTAHVEDDLRHIATDGLRPATLAIGVLYIAVAGLRFTFELSTLAHVLMAIFDLGLAAAGLCVHAQCRRTTLSPARVHVIAAALASAVFVSLVCGATLSHLPIFVSLIPILMIATVSTVLSARWATAIAAGLVVGWVVLTRVLVVGTDLGTDIVIMVGSVGVAVVVHASRHAATARTLELRAGDARREVALQQALTDVAEARRGLDLKVAQRTTALRNEMEERHRLEDQLRQAQKMEAVGRIAGGLAHDFNNLLTVIRLSLISGAAPGTTADEAREAIRDASEATDRAAGLTRDLLAFARKQTLDRSTVAIADIVAVVERMVRRVAEASIRIEVTIAADAGAVLADRHQIEQALLNLAINACDAMRTRGLLSVAVDAVELLGEDAARYRLGEGAYVRIAVIDTGAGMDEPTRRSVFEPVTGDAGHGTGLGLAVAHGIVTQHGGQLSVVSELGAGSTYTVLLPRARGVAPPRAAAAAKPAAALGHETLLVVEDEEAVLRAVQRKLERLGYRVFAAHDGEHALQIVESLDRIDLLLSDVMMPGMDGPELAHRLRARWHELPVLFVTGYSADRLEKSGAVGPRDRVLEKPYELEELARTIRAMVAPHLPAVSDAPREDRDAGVGSHERAM